MRIINGLFSDSFADEVVKLLSSTHLVFFSRIRIPGEHTTQTSALAFLNYIFARSSPDVIAHFLPTECADLIGKAFIALSALKNGTEQLVVHQDRIANQDSFIIALTDSPFIVSTVAERLSEANLEVFAFLHPVFAFDDRVLALSVILLKPNSFNLLPAENKIKDQIIESLRALKTVVNDFDVMTESVSVLPSEHSSPQNSSDSEIDLAEVENFLIWLKSGGLFFIATATLDLNDENLDQNSLMSGAGLWKLSSNYVSQVKQEVMNDIREMRSTDPQFDVRKLRSQSIVHRRATLLHIIFKHPNNSKILSVVGFLTSKAWTSESQDIPFLRHKVSLLLQEESALPNSHDYKYMIEVIDNMPTDDALCASVFQLRLVVDLALGVFSREVSRSLTYLDAPQRRAVTMVVLPPELFSAEVSAKIQIVLESFFGAEDGSSDLHLDSSKRRQFRLYLSTPINREREFTLSSEQDLKLKISTALRSWIKDFTEKFHELSQSAVFNPASFSEEYQAAIAPTEAAADAQIVNSLDQLQQIAVRLSHDPEQISLATISVYSKTINHSISQVIPALENVGLEVVTAQSYDISLSEGDVSVLKLHCRPYDQTQLDNDSFNQKVAPGLVRILEGKASNDPLNILLRRASLSIKEISLLRSYSAFLWQVNKLSTKRTMWESLGHSAQVAKLLVAYFATTFDPTISLSIDERNNRRILLETELIEEFRKVPDVTHDRVLKGIFSLIKATLRTNFFSDTDTFSFKIRSNDVGLMPQPRPLYEIFVFSPRIEGIHLRSAKIARGGIRWSDRLDDYRTEVLGLMKTQKVKNVIIVPNGAKGGFIIRPLPKEQVVTPQHVEAGYREYICALLSLADNVIENKVVKPSGLITYDEDDPYFVVAADKGTATFSDLANSIATEQFHFWLEDAFASGGSAGYDHKKYGITARGGWECVKRHLKDCGIDFESHPFTVIGIGDMSGDVFGNGLILSPQMALIAAFNHKHVFIDPNPNLKAAFDERKRLFSLPRSQWTDFDPSLISEGGKVYGRLDKEIELSKEARLALGIADDAPQIFDGETLINFILKAPATLLWNGGIGTYVKGALESNSDVNDGTNDRVRVSANELRVTIIGEGGNLGLTQRARIEYAESGGRINTDAIDNSGGVDLSDHEVNIKLLLNPIVSQGILSREARNQLLKSVDDQVVESVLRHNYDQSLMLTVSEKQSKSELESYRGLIREMHKRSYINRNRDGLPDEGELDDRAFKKLGLYRPELALLNAATKMWLKEELRESSLCGVSLLKALLVNYFPDSIVKKFPNEVANHPLRNDLITTEIGNSLLPCVGISYPFTLVNRFGVSLSTAVQALLAATRIVNVDILKEHVRALDTAGNVKNFTALWIDLGTAVRDASAWLLTTHGENTTLDELIELYSDSFDTLLAHPEDIFTGNELTRFNRRIKQYEDLGLTRLNSTPFALYRRLLPVFEVLWTTKQINGDERVVAFVFSQVLEELGINTVLKYESVLETGNRWEQELIIGAFQEIRRSVSLITAELIKRQLTTAAQVNLALTGSASFESIKSAMNDVDELDKQKRPFQIAVLPVIARQLRVLKF